MNFIKLPLNLMQLVKDGKHHQCSMEESIAQSIMTQITTRYGEVAGKPDYGSVIWELEFNQLVKIYEWEETVKKSLIKTIDLYEKRLTDVSVEIKLSEIGEHNSLKNHTTVRRKSDILVKGKIIHSGAPFYFSTTVYISPLSQ